MGQNNQEDLPKHHEDHEQSSYYLVIDWGGSSPVTIPTGRQFGGRGNRFGGHRFGGRNRPSSSFRNSGSGFGSGGGGFSSGGNGFGNEVGIGIGSSFGSGNSFGSETGFRSGGGFGLNPCSSIARVYSGQRRDWGPKAYGLGLNNPCAIPPNPFLMERPIALTQRVPGTLVRVDPNGEIELTDKFGKEAKVIDAFGRDLTDGLEF